MRKIEIGGKSVYVFEDHATALLAWSEVRMGMNELPFLLTLDHHTDTRSAFLAWTLQRARRSASRRLKGLHPANRRRLEEVLPDLRHDEHIDAAIQIGALRGAFVIAHEAHQTPRGEQGPRQAKTAQEWIEMLTRREDNDTPYLPPPSRIFKIKAACSTACPRQSPTVECWDQNCDCALETTCLGEKLAIADEMGMALGIERLVDAPYVLDVDLDYFHTWRSLHPHDPSVFYDLIRGAQAVTIATEPGCVAELWLDDQPLDDRRMLNLLLGHIEAAMATNGSLQA